MSGPEALFLAVLGSTSFIAVSIVAVVLYFLPTYIAVVNRHPNKTIVFLLNLLGGWTGMVWLGVLIWACFPGQRVEE